MIPDDMTSGIKIGDELVFCCHHLSCLAGKNCRRILIETVIKAEINQSNDVVIETKLTFVPTCCSAYEIGMSGTIMPRYYKGAQFFVL